MVSPLILAPKPIKENKLARAWRRLSSESSATKSKLVSEKDSNLMNLRRTSTINFGGKKSSLEQHQRHASVQMEPAAKKMEPVGEEGVGELGGFGGLGINFYDHLGNRLSPQAMMSPMLPPRVPGTQSPRVPGTQKPTSPLPKDPPITARKPLVIRESFTRNFTFPGTPEPVVDSEEFLRDLLEKTLRDQSDALCPSPASSRKTSARVNTPKSNRQVSATKPIVTSDAFGFRNYTAPLNLPTSPAVTAYTPTRGPKSGITAAAHARILTLRTPNNTESEGADYFTKRKTSEENSGFTPEAPKDTSYPLNSNANSKIYRIPSSPTIAKRSSRSKPQPQRGELYFFEHERQKIEQLVAQSKNRNCAKHKNCTDCIEKEYAYYENKIMSTSMPPERRQQIMKANRSIRNIKNELENLLEDELITYEAYELMISRLPTENSLNTTTPSALRANVVSPAPAPGPVAPVAAFSQLNVNNDNPPPSYQSTPNLPPRGPTQLPARPEIGRATALYRYTESEDCNFEVGDIVIIFEYMNDDWWMGKNEKTGKEGVFPANYVQKHTSQFAPQPANYGNEKATYSPYGSQQQGPPPPGPSNPYNSSVPPMAVAEQPTDDKAGKVGGMGKNIGKKLGNAAIFGAGATIGGNIVNSIF
ncbi:hypothetical protein SBOR_2972 [Sclerotinia borealis F-4128]|uniref:SH3 domain-containing protein n=1 Tax=Sclerotinia borealis (strain F-4128) TaxID=1432307 RepID=W9CQ26_SCLBF|nr:hypothetical protein SBOR_2972 [Sclerotinia borealis F-4128]